MVLSPASRPFSTQTSSAIEQTGLRLGETVGGVVESGPVVARREGQTGNIEEGACGGDQFDYSEFEGPAWPGLSGSLEQWTRARIDEHGRPRLNKEPFHDSPYSLLCVFL